MEAYGGDLAVLTKSPTEGYLIQYGVVGKGHLTDFQDGRTAMRANMRPEYWVA